ncbi:hypothetical protein C8Q70DRAFT_235576 [Cubamyces menziesii]|nr:hypothetical protein C8Q70DRAFT_235576 [Cubamyces menziesii]
MVEMPLDVCIHILDALEETYQGVGLPPQSTSESLLACALACSSWCDHALKLLYTTIHLRTGTQCRLYLEALAAHPERAEWAKTLVLCPETYIPLVPLLTPGFLPRCSYLYIGSSVGSSSLGYPPNYSSGVLQPLLSQHPGLNDVEFALGPEMPLIRVLSLMRSMPALQAVRLMLPATEAVLQTNLRLKRFVRSNPRIEPTNVRVLIVRAHDPQLWRNLAHATAPVITRLELAWYVQIRADLDAMFISTSRMLKSLRRFHRLKHLTLAINLSDIGQYICTRILSYLPRRFLRELTLDFEMRSAMRRYRDVTTNRLLEYARILRKAFQTFLQDFKCFRLLTLVVPTIPHQTVREIKEILSPIDCAVSIVIAGK